MQASFITVVAIAEKFGHEFASRRYSDLNHNEAQERLNCVGADLHALRQLFGGQSHGQATERLLLPHRQMVLCGQFGDRVLRCTFSFQVNDQNFSWERAALRPHQVGLTFILTSTLVKLHSHRRQLCGAYCLDDLLEFTRKSES